MKISTRGRYGLRAMVDIAVQNKSSSENENCVSIKSISERQGISESYLEQLISPLRKAGYIKSIRGAQGGYILNIDPEKISVGDILRTMEGPINIVDCISEDDSNTCSTSCKNCVTKPVWEKIYESVNNVINEIMLSELVKDYNNLEI